MNKTGLGVKRERFSHNSIIPTKGLRLTQIKWFLKNKAALQFFKNKANVYVFLRNKNALFKFQLSWFVLFSKVLFCYIIIKKNIGSKFFFITGTGQTFNIRDSVLRSPHPIYGVLGISIPRNLMEIPKHARRFPKSFYVLTYKMLNFIYFKWKRKFHLPKALSAFRNTFSLLYSRSLFILYPLKSHFHWKWECKKLRKWFFA